MNKILLYEPDIKLNDIYRSLVDSCVFNHEVVVFYEPEDVTNYLQYEAKGLRLCIFNHDNPQYNGIRLAKEVQNMGLEVPYILITNAKKIPLADINDITEVQADSQILSRVKAKADVIADAIVDTLKKAPDVTQNDFVDSDFCAIAPLMLMYSSSTNADVYTKTDDGQYVILFNKEKEVSAESVQEFISRGMKKFFILSSARADFYDFYLGFLGNKKYNYNQKTEGGNLQIQQQVLAMTLDRIKDLGADEKLVGIAKRNIENNLELINNSNSLKKLLTKIIGKGEVGFEHCMSSGMIAQMILKKLNWKSTDTQYKLSLAAFFHDLFVPSFDKDIQELEAMGKLNPDTIKDRFPEFYTHPAKAAEFLDKLPDTPPDTGQIIADHHELPRGKGFPKKLFGGRTAPLGCVFNTAHYFCMSLYQYGWNKNGIRITFSDMDTFFKDGNYEKPYKALKALFS